MISSEILLPTDMYKAVMMTFSNMNIISVMYEFGSGIYVSGIFSEFTFFSIDFANNHFGSYMNANQMLREIFE